MSNSIVPLKVTRKLDPRVDFQQPVLSAREGSKQIAYLRATANSLAPSVIFTINPPNPSGGGLSRDILIENTFVFNVANTGAAVAGQPILQPAVEDAPRAFPFNSVVTSQSVSIGGTEFTTSNWNTIGHIVRRFFPKKSLYKYANYCPWHPDQSSDYNALTGTNRDEIDSGASNDWDFSRGAYVYYNVVPIAGIAPNVAMQVRLTTREPLLLSPFVFGGDDFVLPFIQQLTLQLNVDVGNIGNMLSKKVNVNSPNTLAVTFVSHSNSNIYYQVLAAPALEQGIPRLLSVPYQSFEVSTGSSGAVAGWDPNGGGQPVLVQFQSQVVNYNTIPSRILVWVGLAPGQNTMNTPDYSLAMARGTQFQVLWNGSPYMTNVPMETLYVQASEQGYAMPWEQWQGLYKINGNTLVGGSGTILCIVPGLHFELPEGQCPGMAGSFQFQVTMSAYNQVNVAVNATLYVCATMPGVLSLSAGGETTKKQGVITTADYLGAIEDHDDDHHEESGGSIYSSLKQALPYAKSVLKHGKSLLSKVPDSWLDGGSSMSGGSDLYGGAKLSKMSLANRIR